MNVLADTSIWIDHFHRANPQFQEFLRASQVWTHAVVIGELAAGRLAHRDEVLRHLQKLPRADEIDLAEGLHLIAQHGLAGRGLSWADIQLLAAAKIGHLSLWTRDRALTAAVAELGLAL